MPLSPELTVFYDGFCPICSREVAGYQRLELKTRIVWIDLAGSDDVLETEAFTLDAALELLHVKDVYGVLHTGLAAHILLWQYLPGFKVAAALLCSSAVLRAVCNQSYLFFTRHRPGLKRRARAGMAGDLA
jgi:predicted DCC family thiol-disulfide oxidoreductase YuxK